MIALLDQADSAPMVRDESRGEAIQRRLAQLGISDREFHTESGVDRKTLRRAVTDDPTVRDNTYRVIEDSLTRLEQHVRGQATSGPVAAQPARIFVIRLKNDVGEVVLEGPPENQAAMVEDAHRLLELMREQAPDDE